MHLFIRQSAILPILLLLGSYAFGQSPVPQNWHHKDPSTDGIVGVGSEKAYELLSTRKPTKVIVAILDSGVDIDHEDLKDNIWVNEDEIPDNGIDDDANGYVDDIHGWNFLGNAAGDDLDQANLEMTRLYRKLAPRFENIESKKDVAKADRADYDLFISLKEKILKELNEAASAFAQIDGLMNIITASDSAAISLFGPDYTLEDVLSWEGADEMEQLFQNVLAGVMQDPDFSIESLEKYHGHLLDKLQYHYNPRFIDRSVLGDDHENTEERFYGNNNVSAPHSDHGTHVAGIVGAIVDNGIGMDGICRNVELMILRTVPNGDEFDKDVANAIRYAADNGAQIINMSFGKSYSPQLEAVHEAILHAEQKGVLMIHAAGNDAENIDKSPNFPNPDYVFQKTPCATWLTVGASSSAADETLVGTFSNFGQKKVDLFAPGVQIYSTSPDNTYKKQDGTSMAAPVVTGVAALIKSYFPEISAVELKDLLLTTSNRYPQLKVLMPDPQHDPENSVKFKKLSRSGGVVNAHNAVVEALEIYP